MFDVQEFLQNGFFNRGRSSKVNLAETDPRLLVVDSSGVIAGKIAEILGARAELMTVTTFADADRILVEDPPDAVVFCVVPCFAMWRVLFERCINERPVIPFLCCAKIEAEPPCSCPFPCRDEDLLAWDISVLDLDKRVTSLIDECGRHEPERFRPGRNVLPETERNSTPQFDIMS